MSEWGAKIEKPAGSEWGDKITPPADGFSVTQRENDAPGFWADLLDKARSAGLGVAHGTAMGWADEGAGAFGAAVDKLAGDEKPFGQLYQEARDNARKFYADESAKNPDMFGAGDFAGNVVSGLALSPLLPGGTAASGVRQLAAQGGIQGAIQGAGGSDSDDALGVAKDTLGGGVMGAGFGAIIGGVPGAVQAGKVGFGKALAAPRATLDWLYDAAGPKAEAEAVQAAPMPPEAAPVAPQAPPSAPPPQPQAGFNVGRANPNTDTFAGKQVADDFGKGGDAPTPQDKLAAMKNSDAMRELRDMLNQGDAPPETAAPGFNPESSYTGAAQAPPKQMLKPSQYDTSTMATNGGDRVTGQGGADLYEPMGGAGIKGDPRMEAQPWMAHRPRPGVTFDTQVTPKADWRAQRERMAEDAGDVVDRDAVMAQVSADARAFGRPDFASAHNLEPSPLELDYSNQATQMRTAAQSAPGPVNAPPPFVPPQAPVNANRAIGKQRVTDAAGMVGGVSGLLEGGPIAAYAGYKGGRAAVGAADTFADKAKVWSQKLLADPDRLAQMELQGGKMGNAAGWIMDGYRNGGSASLTARSFAVSTQPWFREMLADQDDN